MNLQKCTQSLWGSRDTLPSAVPESPSALKLLVLFFLRCFFLLAWGEGGGSSLGLVELEILGLEHTESPSPVSATGSEKAKERKGKHRERRLGESTQATLLWPRTVTCTRCLVMRLQIRGPESPAGEGHGTPCHLQALISASPACWENLKFYALHDGVLETQVQNICSLQKGSGELVDLSCVFLFP